LQQKDPDDYVIATGERHSVTELVEAAFGCVGLDWKEYMSIDRRLYRQAEIHELRGNPSKAKDKLGWQPSVTFEHLIKMMVDSEIESLTHNLSR
jgi:GDPmannose 4,6-dehydratase